ncbi:MAG: hypothetical protein K2Y02_00240 [Burkholderiaceae bacterium]|nr:hypothetical protein [Burkholderiaceae bacterium]
MSHSDPTGYGKPPRSSRFKKGHSGNPAGRPKGRLNVATVFQQALSATVMVNEGGRRVPRTKLQVMLAQLANLAAGGDLQAIRMVLSLAQLLDPDDPQGHTPPDLKADRELTLKILARIGVSGSQGSTPESAQQEEAEHE